MHHSLASGGGESRRELVDTASDLLECGVERLAAADADRVGHRPMEAELSAEFLVGEVADGHIEIVGSGHSTQ